MSDGVIPERSKATGWCFLSAVPLLFLMQEILIVHAEADTETSDAADRHWRPHTQMHTQMSEASDFQPERRSKTSAWL